MPAELFILVFLALACVFFDFKERKIPWWLGYSLLFLGVVFGVRSVGGLLSVVAALAFGFVLWKKGVWGAGDARFLAGLQAWSFVFAGEKWFFLANFLLAVALLFVWLVLRRERLGLVNLLAREKKHSFAFFLLAGFVALAVSAALR